MKLAFRSSFWTAKLFFCMGSEVFQISGPTVTNFSGWCWKYVIIKELPSKNTKYFNYICKQTLSCINIERYFPFLPQNKHLISIMLCLLSSFLYFSFLNKCRSDLLATDITTRSVINTEMVPWFVSSISMPEGKKKQNPPIPPQESTNGSCADEMIHNMLKPASGWSCEPGRKQYTFHLHSLLING